MPTILRVEGFRFFFFSNEMQEPPHVHAEKGDEYAKVWLVLLELSYSQGLTRPELRRMGEIAEEHQATLLERWNEYFADR